MYMVDPLRLLVFFFIIVRLVAQFPEWRCLLTRCDADTFKRSFSIRALSCSTLALSECSL